MYDVFYHTLLPFLLSAVVVIIITMIAEYYGTKTGGIIGTLPHTIIIAFFFIALDKGVAFAANSVVVVPAEMGINLLFLLLFALLAQRGLFLSLVVSLGTWGVLTLLLYYSHLLMIAVSIALFIVCYLVSFLLLDRWKKISSHESILVQYTPLKIVMRGLIAGTVIALAVSLSNIDELMSGIFSVFPAIFLSTMLISMREHGPQFTSAMAKGMIYGSPSVVCYAISIYFLYPSIGIINGTILGFLFSVIVSLLLFIFRKKIS